MFRGAVFSGHGVEQIRTHIMRQDKKMIRNQFYEYTALMFCYILYDRLLLWNNGNAGDRNTPCPKKTCDYIFYNNFNNKCPITIIFGMVSSKSMRHRKMVSFPTSPI